MSLLWHSVHPRHSEGGVASLSVTVKGGVAYMFVSHIKGDVACVFDGYCNITLLLNKVLCVVCCVLGVSVGVVWLCVVVVFAGCVLLVVCWCEQLMCFSEQV